MHRQAESRELVGREVVLYSALYKCLWMVQGGVPETITTRTVDASQVNHDMRTDRFVPNGPSRARVGAICLALSSLIASSAGFAGHPPLPTPCVPGICGVSAQSFVSFGAAGAAYSGSTLNVTQATNKAVLNWANFNIANGYTVNFIQPSATAAILNNIWNGNPSVIAGQLNANGQVYLYNQNGIVFDKGAQVNVAGLTASTLAFSPVANSQDPDALFENGILSANVPGQPPKAAFVAPPQGTAGEITVNNGASLNAADGGRILLLGSAVTNSGSISTPDGQTILGAATDCRRAARFGVSPIMPRSCASPDPTISPTTTTPVAMPTRHCRGTGALSAATPAIKSRPALTARSASSSCAWG